MTVLSAAMGWGQNRQSCRLLSVLCERFVSEIWLHDPIYTVPLYVREIAIQFCYPQPFEINSMSGGSEKK